MDTPTLLFSPGRDSRHQPAFEGGVHHSLHPAQRQRFTVLVVDDNRVKLYVLSRALRAAGFQVVEACSAGEALATTGFGAAVLDVHLPDMDGFALCRRMRHLQPGIPIVQVSSVLIERPYQQSAREAGADAYLAEPDTAELVWTLDCLLHERERMLQSGTHAPAEAG